MNAPYANPSASCTYIIFWHRNINVVNSPSIAMRNYELFLDNNRTTMNLDGESHGLLRNSRDETGKITWYDSWGNTIGSFSYR